MSLIASHLPWGVDFATGWIALVAINFTSPMHDGLNDSTEKYCAGAFVGESWFLTSASCLEPLPEPYEVTVMTGWGDFDCSQQEIWAFKSIGLEIELHPGYEERSFVDLAMVRTRRTAYRVPKAMLSPAPHKLLDSDSSKRDKCRLLSFDDTHPEESRGSLHTHTAGFLSVHAAECPREDQEGRICTENGKADVQEIRICPGKLGALLECDGQLTGVLTQPVIATSTICDLAGHLQMFEDIGQHRNWIEKTIKEAYNLIYSEGPPKGWVDRNPEELTALEEEYYGREDLHHHKATYHDDDEEKEEEEEEEEEVKVEEVSSDNLNLYIASIVVCVFCMISVIHFCHVQLHRFDHHIDI